MKNTIPNLSHHIIVAFLTLTLTASIPAQAEEPNFTEEQLCYMPATDLVALFKTGELSPVDVVEAQIKRIGKYEDKVNALTYTYFDEARKAAKESEARYKAGNPRTLEGITVGIKDEHYDKGWIVSQGSLVHKNDPPKDHADNIVAKLKAAGAIPFAQTTVPELYLHYVTDTKAWGTSRNPWNLKYAVGGSSGGSGAALAAGFCTLATGSDMGGSIRIPSAFNGLYGYKTAFGQYHTDLPMSHFSGSGPMARTAEDLVLMHNAISGPGNGSINVYYTDKLPAKSKSLKGLNIAYVGGMGIVEPAESVDSAMKDAMEALRQSGATVDVVKLDLGKKPEDISEGFSNMALSGAMGGMFAGYADKADQMTTYGNYFVNKAAKGGYGNAKLFEAEQMAVDMFTRMEEQVFSKGYDLMILPTLPTSHIKADHDFTTDVTKDEGREWPKLEGGLYTVPFNFLNWCPVISVPAGLTEQSMPVGMQIVGLPKDTELVFQVAREYSKHVKPLFTKDRMPQFTFGE